MSERRGVERLRWLLEDDPNLARGVGSYPPITSPRHQWMSDKEVQIEVAQALIEELHDALDFWRRPQIVIKSSVSE